MSLILHYVRQQLYYSEYYTGGHKDCLLSDGVGDEDNGLLLACTTGEQIGPRTSELFNVGEDDIICEQYIFILY